IDTFLGRGTKVNGKLVLEGTARIEGQVEGEISARDALTVGEGAVVNAKISGTSIVIEGRVTGDVTARERLELRASGRVQGSVTTASLVVHEGALLDGRCSMGGGEVTARREKPATTAPVSADRRAPDPPVPVPAARRVARRSAAEHQAARAEVQRRQRVRVVAVSGERLLHLIETDQREDPGRCLRVRILVDLDARFRVHGAVDVVPVLQVVRAG